MYESIYKNNELENEVSLDMSYFWYSDGYVYLDWIKLGFWPRMRTTNVMMKYIIIHHICLMALLIL